MQQHPVHSSQNWRSKSDQGGARTERSDENAATAPRSWRKDAQSTSSRSYAPNRESQRPSPPQQEDEKATAAIAEGRRIYVGNLVYHAQPSDVTEHFTAAGYTISRLAISMDPFTGRNPSYCFVELDSKEAADNAMEELNGTLILGRPLKIRPCVPKTRQYRGKWAPGHLQHNSSFDRWTRTNEDLPTVNTEKRRLHISGLPRRKNQAEFEDLIRELFEGFEIRMVSKVIAPNRNPRTRYFAFVDFENARVAEEARRAVDGTWMDGTRVSVSVARGEPKKPAQEAGDETQPKDEGENSMTAEPSKLGPEEQGEL